MRDDRMSLPGRLLDSAPVGDSEGAARVEMGDQMTDQVPRRQRLETNQHG